MKRNEAITMKRFPFERVLKMTRTMLRAGIAAGLLLLCGPAFAQVRITWATEDLGSKPAPAPPLRVLNAPDGKVSGLSSSAYIYIRKFTEEKEYTGLARLLGLTDEELNRWDLIAFEGQSGKAPGGGWESSIWFITDQIGAVAGSFDEKPKSTEVQVSSPCPLKFKSGTITAAEYVGYFDLKGGLKDSAGNDVAFASWILVDIPDDKINLNAEQFRIWVTGAQIGEGTPDPDAFGVIRRTTR